MSIRRILKILIKDLRLGPRSPIFLWALTGPAVMTLVVQGIFGSLLEPVPRMGLVDQGRSKITHLMSQLEDIDLTLLKTISELKLRVEGNDLDAGLVLPDGFDTALLNGQKPLLEFYIGGQSPASSRIILTVTALDMVRRVEGKGVPVEIKIDALGDTEALPISTRLVPAMVLFALLIAGVFLTAFGLVDEREKNTLWAVLVTPVRLSEVLVAKAGLGFILSILMALVTLLLNGALGSHPAALLITLIVAGMMSVELGLIYGMVARDSKTLFTLSKTLNIFLVAPVIFYLFPDWPQWIAKIFPTYWLINPVFEVAIKNASLMDVGLDLGVAIIFCGLFIIPVQAMKKRVQAGLYIC